MSGTTTPPSVTLRAYVPPQGEAITTTTTYTTVGGSPLGRQRFNPYADVQLTAEQAAELQSVLAEARPTIVPQRPPAADPAQLNQVA